MSSGFGLGQWVDEHHVSEKALKCGSEVEQVVVFDLAENPVRPALVLALRVAHPPFPEPDAAQSAQEVELASKMAAQRSPLLRSVWAGQELLVASRRTTFESHSLQLGLHMALKSLEV